MGTGVAVGAGVVAAGARTIVAAVGVASVAPGVGPGVWKEIPVGAEVSDPQAKSSNSRPDVTMVLTVVKYLMPPLLTHPITTDDYSSRGGCCKDQDNNYRELWWLSLGKCQT